MKISLITCAYNTEKFLRRCFDSIENQSFTDFEVIVINDGSTDNSQIIIDEYIKKDSRFRVINQSNSGQAIARNVGIKEAKGDYIVFIDSDDEIKENYLLSLSKVIDNNLDFAFSKYIRVFDDKPNILEKNFNYINAKKTHITNTRNNPELLVNVSNAPFAKIIKKCFLVDNNIYFYPNKIYEDFLFTVKLLLSNPNMMFIDDDSYVYHVRSGTTMTNSGNRVFEIFEVYDAIIDFAKSNNVFDVYHDELEYLAFHHIAIGTTYRSFRYKPFSFFSTIKKCRTYLKKFYFKRKNKYIKQSNVFERIFLFLFFSI